MDNANNLAAVLEDRRRAAGENGKPMGYKRWGEILRVWYTTLFRFAKGDKALGIEAIRTLAEWANQNNDNELLEALAAYALDIPIKIVETN